jgi:Zn-dependent M28 family amino/carboxypeptidase
MADIGARGVVPGANDNLSGVAAQMSVAHALAQDPPAGTRIILLFPGSEESFEEGMQAWARRHFDELPRESTTFVCLDTVGSPRLMLLEGEGMLGIYEYPAGLKRHIHALADELGIELVANLRFRNATDGLVALRAGYPSAMIGSIDEFKAPANYHWPTDTAENVDYGTVADCARLCLELARRW